MTDAAATPTFAELGLPEKVVASLTARGISTPTPVQAGVIPLALEGGDLLAQARTGSGKTLAFLLPLVARIQAGELHHAWVICPTRELAQQAAREAATILGEGACAVLVGGQPAFPQIRELRRNPPLILGTPGRMCDHLAQGNLKPDAEIVVLDEADQMMDMGFAEELEKLVKDLDSSVARWLFSATFPRQVQDAVERWLDNPRTVRLDTSAASSHVPQHFTVAPRGQEPVILARLLHILEPSRAMVFVRTREDVERVSRAICEEGIEAAGISGDLTQEARERVLERFRSGKLIVLVGTDVAARGIDVPGVTHVFNLGLPISAESYTHRVGRTARAGAAGEAWTVIGAMDRAKFARMAAIAKAKPVESPVPSAGAIVDAKRERLAKRVQESLGEKLSLPKCFAPLVTEFGAEAVLAAFVHRLIPDAPPERAPVRPSAAVTGPQGSASVVVLYLGIGMEDGVQPGTIVAMLCHQCGLTGDLIGRMKLFPRHTLVQVRPAAAQRILEQPPHHRGRAIPVRADRDGPSAGPVGRGPARPPYRPR